MAGSDFESRSCNFGKLDIFRDDQMILLSYLAITINQLEKKGQEVGSPSNTEVHV